MKDSRKFNLTVIAIAFLSLLFLVGWWLMFGLIKNKYAAVEKLKADLSIAAKRQDRIRQLEKTIRDLTEENRKISSTFVSERELVRVIEEFENIASKTNTSLKMESVSSTGNDNPIFQFNVSGEFSDIFQYLTLLEDMPYEIAVYEARLQKPRGEALGAKGKKYPWEGKFKIKLLSYEAS